MRRHFDSVTERFESRFNVVADGVLSLTEHAKTIHQRLASLDSRVDSHGLRITALENRPKA